MGEETRRLTDYWEGSGESGVAQPDTEAQSVRIDERLIQYRDKLLEQIAYHESRLEGYPMPRHMEDDERIAPRIPLAEKLSGLQRALTDFYGLFPEVKHE